MATHDPAVIAGWILIGSSSVLYIHVELKMVKAGHKTPFEVLSGPLSSKGAIRTFTRYLRVCIERCWPPWPVYLFLQCLVAGTGLLVFGLLRLQPLKTGVPFTWAAPQGSAEERAAQISSAKRPRTKASI